MYPSNKYRRLLKRGLPIIEKKLDIVYILNCIKKLQIANNIPFCEHAVDLDADSDSDSHIQHEEVDVEA